MAGVDGAAPAAAAGGGAAAAAADPESVAMLTSMGFTAAQAEGALKATQGALDRAADWCAPSSNPSKKIYPLGGPQGLVGGAGPRSGLVFPPF
eukprot:1177557-Prorocentrum_minimum.AAC.5